VRKAKFKGLVLVVPYRRGKVDLAQVLKAFARCQKEKKGKKGKCTSESVKHEPKKIGKGRTKKTGKSKREGKTGKRAKSEPKGRLRR